MGKLFAARAFIGRIGGTRNLSIELLDVTTRNGIYFTFIRMLTSLALRTPGASSSYKIHRAFERLEKSLVRLTKSPW
jgi:hypothetical protein